MAAQRYLTTQELAGLAAQLIQQVHETSKPARHLTIEQLADRLQMEEAALAVWRKNGRGPAYIRGESDGHKATIRYMLADVVAWEKSHRIDPADLAATA